MSSDPYCYPGTTILKNKFDIQNEEELRATEARVAAAALFALAERLIAIIRTNLTPLRP